MLSLPCVEINAVPAESRFKEPNQALATGSVSPRFEHLCPVCPLPPQLQWLRGNLFCPGSLADSAATCTAAYYDRTSPYNTTGTAPLRCASRPGCAWLPGGDPAPPAAPEDGALMSSTANGGLVNGHNTGLTVSDVPVSLLVPSLLAAFYDRRWSDGKSKLAVH